MPNEEPTGLAHLDGEIPRAFPTIHAQLRSIPEQDGRQVDVLLLNGGANDVDFEAALAVGEDFATELEEMIRRIFYDDVLELIAAARQRCPNAQIVYSGYFSAFSSESSFGGMRDMFLSLTKHKDDYKLLSGIYSASPPLGYLLYKLSGAADEIEDAIAAARVLEYGESRSNYWARRAVSEICELPAHAPIRGPGVVFVAAGFRPENCVFAAKSFIWQQFEEDARRRCTRCSRQSRSANSLRNRMEILRDLLGPTAISTIPETVDVLRKLHNVLDGPVELLERLKKLAENTAHMGVRNEVWEALGERARPHPSRAHRFASAPALHGAAHYASVIQKRAEQGRQVSVRERMRAFLPPAERSLPGGSIQIGRQIRRFGLTTAVGLRACLAHAEPDVLGLTVRTHRTSDAITGEAFLNLGNAGRHKLRYLLMKDLQGDIELNPHFKADKPDFFTIDVAGQIAIGDITQAVIEFEGGSESEQWTPEIIEGSIDGRSAFPKLEFTIPLPKTRRLDLGFPLRV